MTTATMRRRTQIVESAITARAADRTLRRIATALGIAPELLRAEAIALQRRFAEAGVVSERAQVDLVASELVITPEELSREITDVLAAC